MASAFDSVNNPTDDDKLVSDPPSPDLKTAKPPGKRDKPSGSPIGAAAMAMMGGSRAARVMSKIKQIEQLVTELSHDMPEAAPLAAPILEMLRDTAASSIANAAQGGAPVSGDTVPPPGMGPMGPGGGDASNGQIPTPGPVQAKLPPMPPPMAG